MTASSHPGAPAPTPPYAAAAAAAQAAPVPLSSVQLATGVIRAAMEGGSATATDIAQAEHDAGILYDPRRAQDVWDEAYTQACAEYAADLHERGEQLAIMTAFKHRLDRVMRLLEGRPGDDTMLVREILTAAHGTNGTLDIPLTLAWDRSVDVPEQGAEDQRAIVQCTTPHGGRAHLVLTKDERLGLASLLDAEIVRDINAPCPTDGCGTVDDYDASDPTLFGWTRIEVAGTEQPPRWYCAPACVSRALARAGAELAEADHRAELDGDL